MVSKLINQEEGHQFLKVAAPTGSAAYNVDGATLHSLLQIPVKFDDKNCAPPLDGDQLQRLQATFKGTHLLWIDEKSMVSTTRLYQIDQRLKQARPENADLPFGGISVILMGDYAQLPPVKEKAVYDSVQGGKEHQTRGKNLYYLFRKVIRLTESKRQEGDEEFKDLLSRVADGPKLEQRHHDLMDKRSFPILSVEERDKFWKEAVYICALNADLVPFNIARYRELDTPVAVIEAVNTGKGAKSATPDTAGGLLNYVILAVGGKVLLKSKLWQEAGLVNGANGVVKKILYQPGNAPPQLPDCVLVEFEHYNGPALIEDEPKLIPVIPVTSTWYAHKEDCSRTQVPLVPGDATTIHVTQGATLEKAIVNLGKKEFACGISYTGMSRVRALKDLIFYKLAPNHLRFKFMENKPFKEKKCEDERLERLETIFVSQIRNTIPKPNYDNPDVEGEWEMDSSQITRNQLQECLAMVPTHDQLKQLATGRPNNFSPELIKQLEDLQKWPLKTCLMEQDIPRLMDIVRVFSVIGLSGRKPQHDNIVKKIIEFIKSRSEEEKIFNIKMMKKYLRYVKIVKETDGKQFAQEHAKKTAKEMIAFAQSNGLKLAANLRKKDMREALVSVQLENKISYGFYFREMEEMKTQIMDHYISTNQSPQSLASTILRSIFSTSDMEITNNLDANKSVPLKRKLVQEKLKKAERPELEACLNYLLGLQQVPRCVDDKDIKTFLKNYPLYSYVFFVTDHHDFWKKPIVVE